MPLLISIRIEFYNKSITERLSTLNMATWSRTHGAMQNQQKHLERPLEVIQGHAFWNTEKPTIDCILLYNNLGFKVSNSERKV